MRNALVAVGGVFAVLLSVSIVTAQRGAGERKGVARQPVKPEVQTIRGTLKEIKTDPCDQTTGRSPVGTHLILQAEDGPRNLHLGPASEVGDVVGMLQVGDTVEAKAFRTSRLPEDQFIAISVESGDQEIVLRDDSLRPRWAGGRDEAPGAGQPRAGEGRGVRAEGRGSRLAFSRVLDQADALDLNEEQVEKIEMIIEETEERIRDVLTEQQLDRLRARPRGVREGRQGPR